MNVGAGASIVIATALVVLVTLSFSTIFGSSWALEKKLHMEKLHTDAQWTEEERVETKGHKK